MKNIAIKLAALALLISGTACQEKLDVPENSKGTGSSHNYSAVYMSKKAANISIPNAAQAAATKISISMSTLMSYDVPVTVAVTDFFAEYNKKNNTTYKMLPVGTYELYEVANPANTTTNGILNLTIKKGSTIAEVGVRVKPLDGETYPLEVKYAIPLRIASASLPVLSNKDLIVTLDRPYRTSVVKIKQGFALAVQAANDIKESNEFTVQAHYLFTDFHAYDGVHVNMSLFQGPMLPYTRISEGKIQVKNGGGDSADDWGYSPDIAKNKWCQITFAYKDPVLKLYINGKLIKTHVRPSLKVAPGMRVNIENTQTSYSADRYMREFRIWNRELSEGEIKDGLYLPSSPESNGLIVYLPLNKRDEFKDMSKYNNTTIFRRGTSRSNMGIQDGDSYVKDIEKSEFLEAIEWVENVKFPAEGLDTSN